MSTRDAIEQIRATPQALAKKNVNLPNLLTAGRILLIPVFVLLFSSPTPTRTIAAACVFLLAALTDLLDGYVARRRAQVTPLGRLLDPIADKLLVVSGLILLVDVQRVAAPIAIALVAREVAVTGIRAIAASEGVLLSAESTGKYKMAAQVIAIVLLILEDATSFDRAMVHLVGVIFLFIALILAVLSGSQYLLTFWRQTASKTR